MCCIGCSRKAPQKTVNQTISEYHKKAKASLDDSTLIRLKLAEDLIAGSDNIPDSLKIENLYIRGYYYEQKKLLDSATVYLHKATHLIDSTNFLDKHYPCFRKAWNADLKLEHYSNGINTALKYIELSNKVSDQPRYLEYAYYFLAQVNKKIQNKEKENLYLKKSLQLAKAAKNDYMSNTISLVMAEDLYKSGKEKAFKYLDSLLLEQNTIQLNRGLHFTYGVLKFRSNNFKGAIEHYKNEVSYIKKDPEFEFYDTNMTYAYCNIAEALIELKEYDKAQTYLDSTSFHLNQNTGTEEYKYIGYLKLVMEYQKGGDLKVVNRFFDDMVEIQNKAHEKKIEEELQALSLSNEKQKVLEKEKQKAEIDNLKLKSKNSILLISAISLILIGYFIYRQRQYRFEKQSLLMQQRLLRSQMNPHFISNTLYAIQNEIKKDQESSVKYLTTFSRLLRTILENSMQDYVVIEKEIESIRKYLELQLLKHPNRFTYDFEFDTIDIDLIHIPPMLIQPFVENSIEHGFSGIDYKGKIDISLSIKGKHVFCSIEDNGRGFNTAEGKNDSSASMKLISDFIYKSTKTKVSIVNRKDQNSTSSGTRVEFLIPFK